MLLDEACEFGFLDNFCDEVLYFFGLAHELEFNRAVFLVSDPADDVEPECELLSGVTEAHTLHPAAENNALG